MIDVHQNATLSESFEGNMLRVIGNRCNSGSQVLQVNTFARIESVCAFRDGLSFLTKGISLIKQSTLPNI